MALLLIGLCGLIGIFSRHAADVFLSRYMGAFPFPTLMVNLLGSLVAGFIFSIGVERQVINAQWRAALLVGFAGGFTTFSSYTLQTVVQWELGYRGLAVLYLFVSPVAGAFFTIAGLLLGRLIFSNT